MKGCNVLLFGPQALSYDRHDLARLRSSIIGVEGNAWMQEVLRELPHYAKIFAESIPRLHQSRAPQLLQTLLERWLDPEQSTILADVDVLPNALLTPLVVLDQLAQYSQYSEITHDQKSRREETVGFCTGSLSALAVSSASTKTELQLYGARAVRLAALVGALVDAEDAGNQEGKSKSLSAAWNTSSRAGELVEILSRFPEAYISVHYDENRATITTSETTVAELQKQLRSSGFIASEISLRGRFHYNAYQDDMQSIIALCDSTPELQLPNAEQVNIFARSSTDGSLIASGKLHQVALRQILIDTCQWGKTFDTLYQEHLDLEDSALISFGPEKCVPPSFGRRVNDKIIYMTEREHVPAKLLALSAPSFATEHADDDIAVVGMACKVAGADDVEEFWDLMARAESQHVEVPQERFTFETQWRETDPKRKWFGNFVRDHDAFDHKFFKKSPREVSSQDPQQRLLLQSAYQAVEQSGYFRHSKPDTRVGVFVGVCANDYAQNVACHAPNAFTATGNLTSFLAGKISHYFGWTGPGLTIDTACSASAVAIHQACRAIVGGECNAALAGGTNIMTGPTWFQNLAGASFLSQTGSCKPFDASADGYCRGEGIASVFLKRMSHAIRDGDQIIGSIRSTGVFQNENCTPIFVPNAPSLSSLFEHVVDRARLQPKDITLVEAHGTGTPVGDPAEWASIRQVLGGPLVRSSPIPIGSVKGLIGHTECVSGVMALIKILVLLHKGFVPPQASFKTLSPGLKAKPDDMLEVVTKTQPWASDFRAALINNYGASGSNASMVITQAPQLQNGTNPVFAKEGEKFPFWLTGLDERSLKEYATRLRQWLTPSTDDVTRSVADLANVAFNAYRQSNRNLPLGLIFGANSVKQLDQILADFIDGSDKIRPISKKAARPVILCFGGQISRTVGLSRAVYDSTALLRKHLGVCNEVCKSLGLGELFPAIFEKDTVTDPVKLQTMLFSLQYSSAQCWIDSGIEVAAVVGHSFGELTASCVSGVLSLRDALRLISSRAQLIKTHWGSDSGAMMAVEGNISGVKALLKQASEDCPLEKAATIACFNGPTSFTLAGSTKAIDAVESCISSSGLQGKRLSVTNAFHSTLVEPLEEELSKIAMGTTFNDASIRWERATEVSETAKITPVFFSKHMRDPVYFNHACQRLHQELPNAIWLEAGSNSTITKMASKALSSPSGSVFQGISLTSDSSVQLLADATVNLWKEGLPISHWTHHDLQSSSYQLLFLPPYQFEKTRHWMELKKPQKFVESDHVIDVTSQSAELPTSLYTFVGYQDGAKQKARFRINTMISKYNDFVSGHLIAKTAPICPATLEVDIAVEALRSLSSKHAASNMQPEILDVENLVPVCVDPSRAVWLDVQNVATNPDAWSWQWTSTDSKGVASTVHVKGQIRFRSTDNPQLQADFARYRRLVDHDQCLDVLNCPTPDDVIQGRNMYKLFGEIVDYSERYQGLQKLVGKGNISAGRVLKKHSGETWLDTTLSDCFSQVGGFWVNCMTDRSPNDMYIAAGFESWMRSPYLDASSDQSEAWDVMARHHKTSDKSFTTDIFIFNAVSKELREVIFGIQYARIPKSVMSKTIQRLTASDASSAATPPPSNAVQVPVMPIPSVPESVVVTASEAKEEIAIENAAEASSESSGTHILTPVIEILAELSGLEASGMALTTNLADIGIDSLMGMEMAHELESKFECTLDTEILSEVLTIRDVVQCVAAALGVNIADADSDDESVDSRQTGSETESKGASPESMTSVSSMDDANTDVGLKVSPETIIESFGETKMLTDSFITNYGCSGYMDNINPKQTQLCVALTLEAFEQLGCNIKTAKPGEAVQRIDYAPQHVNLANYLYEMLETDARLVDTQGDKLIRTSVSVPTKTSKEILANLVKSYPDHNYANELAYFCGSRLVEVLQGKLDGVKLIFGNEEGRTLVGGLYGDSLLNKLFYKQMEDVLKRIFARLPRNAGPFKILEMGGGTLGTTKYLVPLLAELNVPVEYTFTDLSPSFVAAARKKLKAYPFVKFRAHDIENVPADDLIGTQHLVVASNAVHATHSLTKSLTNIRKALRPDGFLMMLEMTETVRWVDIIFGLLEGWWLFDDGRTHALSHQTRWERDMHATGYGHVDWTDGHLPENKIQRIIIAMASGEQQIRLSPPEIINAEAHEKTDTTARQSAVNKYVHKYTQNFQILTPAPTKKSSSRAVLITGATGSLGSHLVSHFASSPDVQKVICLNRVNRLSDPNQRQHKAFEERGIQLKPKNLEKLHVIEADTSKPAFGLSADEYTMLTQAVTHIVHNAWPMSGNRPVTGFENQFQVIRNLIDLACEAQSQQNRQITFQFVSSIAVVGHQPLQTGVAKVLEERVTIDSVLPNGYGDAKWACELILDNTLHKHPEHFRTMSVRLGQVAGSSNSGYWNIQEHLSFLIKSSQTLRALPDFDGVVSWTPVDIVASTLGDLALRTDTPHPTYHIDNPVRQPWKEMTVLLSDQLNIPRDNIIPFKEWVRRVRHFPGSTEKDNPAFKLIGFLDHNFVRMSCGGLLLDTAKTCEHSPSLAHCGPVSNTVTAKYIRYWKQVGFLADY